jgi:hypothetical protein
MGNILIRENIALISSDRCGCIGVCEIEESQSRMFLTK